MLCCHNLAAAVVMYNCSLADSPTCRGLEALAGSGLTILIYDNSTADFGLRQACLQQGWVYLGGQGNLGLSRAYNCCIDYLQAQCPQVEYISLWDDDTALSQDYFQVLTHTIQEKAGDVFLPLITSAGHLLSPCLLSRGYVPRRFSDAQQALDYRGSAITGINSGMAIRLALFANYRYDEHIFLDGVDHRFLRDQHRMGKTVTVMPYTCSHSFSGDSRPSRDSALKRFSIFVGDYRYILHKQPFARFFLLGKRCIRLTLQYKTSAFFKCFFTK